MKTAEEKAKAKAEKKARKAEMKSKKQGFWKEFKAFISRGSILDMSVGVILGGAFNAIVSAFTNILLSVCTWGVPGGLKGLVTVLPAANAAQAGYDPANGLDQIFNASELQSLATAEAVATYGQDTVDATPTLIESVKSTILSKYTLHGSVYTYNMSAVIDWGTFINAIISFLIIALTLFMIVKIVRHVEAKSKYYREKALEQYYEKHPEERPVPPEPGKPAPTEMDILVQIRDELKQMNAGKAADKPAEAAPGK
jgi:large-conductance mechanosensitive channel